MDAAKERVILLFLSFVSDNWRKFLFPIAVLAVVAAFLLIPRGQANNSEQNLFPELIEPVEAPNEEVIPEQSVAPALLIVDVKGAVHHPGVYTLEDGDRIIDAITAAGGYVPEADSRTLNHAMKLTDEFLIYVPLIGEEIPEGEASPVIGTANQASSQSSKDGVININTADESQLMTIPGIGPAKANAIINYRNDHGPFKAPESLMDVSGIGKKTFEKFESQITVK